MITILDINYSTGHTVFAISSAADIADLPTMTAPGQCGNESFEPVKAGSSAITTSGDTKLYMLDGATNEWKER